ncbi:MAG: septal ring lytic transglycosylase RlpA family protein [Rhodospirillaceae bacterium]|nr:septal ring lytic transglycosylase RlpA family protein [Rhodospirillaceae bacterium]MBT3927533.1 septal ring lytic transglycosylase RlpA family protein [Rhodospirillaceae bacterium]MBT4425881.1 septal ring lytic transglycosylase RlpA family protein [Rhodospirillaceae bacterium]MBT5676896.1 septal ring lytic transglycosylase RlpA family protein [Rhodospirillaceae bacterium]
MMKYRRFLVSSATLLAAVLFLSACAETDLLIHGSKKLTRIFDEEAEQAPSQPVPAGYKLGNPYVVAGIRYFPRFDAKYNETGTASWYGEPFHGRNTANGERYDMNELTAAHKTMPMPSLVRVTNLENGRILMLRVNDRGPFVNGRIIDISRRGAQLLGFYRKGTAKVRVEFIKFAPLTVVAKAPVQEPEDDGIAAGDAPGQRMSADEVMEARSEPFEDRPDISSQYLDAPIQSAELGGIEHDALTAQPDPANGTVLSGIFIQVGAFAERSNAVRLARQLNQLSPSVISAANINGVTWFRVRMGPLADVVQADRLLDRTIAAGYANARLIVAR